MEVRLDATGAPYVDAMSTRLRFECEQFEDEMTTRVAENELRETPARREEALRELRRLLAGDPELHVPADDDAFLLKFLRPCKFYPESAFERMKKYYQFRVSHPVYCTDLWPSNVQAPFLEGVISILSPRDSLGRRYMLIESGSKWDYRKVPVTDVFRGMQMALEAAMAEPRTQVCGVVVIFDMKGLSFGHVMQFTPMFAKTVVDFIQDCIPIRLKAVHVINQPYIFNMLFAVFRPFLRDKLRSRIHFHGTNRASLLAHVEPQALRTRHGGTIEPPDVPGEIMAHMLMHYEDHFRESSVYGYPRKQSK